jgi:putative tryptophan/tyrosine transport system substrate-binding protein
MEQTARSSKNTESKLMRKNVTRLTLCIMLLAFCVPAQAQQPARIPRIGYVSGTGNSSNPGPYVEALRQGLRDLGYIEGKNIVIEYRGAEAKLDRIPSLVAELVQLRVDVLVVPVLPAIRAAKQATKTIPIVMVTQADPVVTGIIESLARPGGNITGLATLSRELSGKRVELVKEAVPRISRLAVLRDLDAEGAAISFKEYEAVALALKIPVQSLEVRGPNLDLDGAFQSALNGRASALITITTIPIFRRQKQIADLAAKNRLPSMFEGSTWVESGGLMSYSTDDVAVYRRAAVYVDKILKGTKPVDIPVEQPTKFEFVINLKTAKQIGLTIPSDVLSRADRIIR